MFLSITLSGDKAFPVIVSLKKLFPINSIFNLSFVYIILTNLITYPLEINRGSLKLSLSFTVSPSKLITDQSKDNFVGS